MDAYMKHLCFYVTLYDLLLVRGLKEYLKVEDQKLFKRLDKKFLYREREALTRSPSCTLE